MTIDHVPAILILSMVIPLTSEGCSDGAERDVSCAGVNGEKLSQCFVY